MSTHHEKTDDLPPELRSRFADYLSNERSSEWERIHRSVSLGAVVSGPVVFRPPFGVYLDVGLGYPALLLATRFSPQLDGPRDLPAIGKVVAGSVIHYSDSSRQIVLQQP